jgi:uncharacterized protein involved in exopolysaccharide biosynthesis
VKAEDLPITTLQTEPAAKLSPSDDAPSVISLVNVFLRQRRTIARTIAILVLAAIVLTLVQPRYFTSKSAFTPQERKGGSSISGLAAQLGLSIPGADDARGPDFYIYVLKSAPLLRATLQTQYAFNSREGRQQGTLLEHLEIKGETAARREAKGLEELRDLTNARLDLRSGIIELRVRTRHAALSQQVNTRMLALLNDFNLRTLQSQAAAERRFTEARLKEVSDDLRQAENRLREFQERNRILSRSPQLGIESQRLEREVFRQNELYTTLAQAFEHAKIEEVRNTPVVTIVEPPDTPAKPDPRGTVKLSIIALLAGAVLGMLLAFARDSSRRAGGFASEAEEFKILRSATARDLRRPWRLLLPGRKLGQAA